MATNTVNVNALVADAAVGTAESVTANVTLVEPTADGMPDTTPPLDNDKPAGNDPLDTDQ